MDFIKLFDQTKAAFAEHQSNGNRYNYPRALKQNAVSLLKYYSAQALSHELNISARSLRNWQEAASTTPIKQSKKSTVFIPITLGEGSAAAEPISPSSDSLTLKLPHDLELILPAPSVKGVAQFIYDFIQEFSRCSI